MSSHLSDPSTPSEAPAEGTPVTARPASRRAVLTGAAALAAAGYVAPTAAHATGKATGIPRGRLIVLGTTDLHGNVFNWDYYKNAEFDNAKHDDIGIAKVATLIKGMRAEHAGVPMLTIDAGDTIQGTPLAYYYARIDPISQSTIHPMARAMNLIGYDAAALGNHEFNYGLDILRTFQSQLDFPLLGANAVDVASKLPAFPPYVIKTVRYKNGPELKIGILGLTNPGIAIWDHANVEGRLEFPGLVEQAKVFVPRLKKAGCDLVIVSAHSGMDTSSSYGEALPYPENAASLVAEQVPDVDAILVGHAHKEYPSRTVKNAVTGREVLLSEPLYWGMRLTVMDFALELRDGHWRVADASAQLLNSNQAAEDQQVADAVRSQHQTVVSYVNSVIGTSTTAMSAARAVVEDVPIIDFVNYVQADAVKADLTGADASLPVLSIAAPFNRQASFPAGEVTLRDVAGLYIYDNTLLGVKVTGSQVKDYLEYSARYFTQVSGQGPFTMDDVTNALQGSPVPTPTPDYNFDSVAGLDAPLTYRIDIAQAPGSRILDLSYDGLAVQADQEFVMAINNYRQGGGGGFPWVKAAPVVYNRQVEIRQLLIDWVLAHHVIDPTQFASVDWTLVANGQSITIT